MGEHGIAVVGLGFIGVQHAEAVHLNPRASLRALCGTEKHMSRVKELARKYDVARVTSSFDDILADDGVEIVYLCTPNQLHADQAVAALRAGKHVFVEKPLANTIDECRRIVEEARRAQGKLMVGYICRFSPVFMAAKKFQEDGTLGKVAYLEGDYIHDLKDHIVHYFEMRGEPIGEMEPDDYLRFLREAKSWWSDSANMDLPLHGGACHPLDLMRWIAGDVSEVHAIGCKIGLSAAPFTAILLITSNDPFYGQHCE